MTQEQGQWKPGDKAYGPDGKPVIVTGVNPDGTVSFRADTAARNFVGVMQDNPVTAQMADPVAAVMDKGWAEGLPYALGMAGSIAGGKKTPAGVGLAAVGGATGEAIKNAVQGQPITPANLLKAGAVQGGMELVGRGVQAGSKSLARRGYQSLLKPTLNQRREFPEAVDALIREGAAISPGGVGKVDRAITQSSNRADQMAAAVSGGRTPAGFPTPQAAPITASDVAPSYRPYLDRLSLRERAGDNVGAERNAVAERLTNLSQQSGMTPTEAIAVKREQQKMGDEALRSVERGNKALSATDELNLATGKGLQIATENRVPGLGAVNANTASLIGGKEMLEQAIGRESNTALFGPKDWTGAAIGGTAAYATGNPALAIPAWLAVRALSTPSIGSRVYIGMDRTSRLPYAQAMRAAMLAKLGLDEDGQPASR